MLMTLTAQAQQSDNYRSLLRNRNVKIDRTNLPIVFINVGGQMIMRDQYVLGRMKIIHNGDGQTNYGDTLAHQGQVVDYEGFIALKYRGNSSFDSSNKKPFAFRTLQSDVLPEDGGAKQKVKILGMAKDNKWGFIAPWADEAMFRDVLSFELARPWMDWVPAARMCEVILDGTYYGVYVLCERVSKGKHRLDLNDPGADEGDLTGDYHVSVDHGYDPYFTSKYRPWQSLDGSRVATNYTIKYEYGDPDPEEFGQLPAGVRQALTGEVDKMEASFRAANWLDPQEGYRKYIDPMSFIDYMLATELSMNIDGYRLSTHLYKHSETRARLEGIDARWKLTLWDFNIAWGNANYYDGDRTDRWQYMLNINFTWDDCPVPFYWYRLLQDDNFVEALHQRWQQYRQANHSDRAILATIDSLATLITSGGAAQRNEEAWGVFQQGYIWPIPYYAQSYDDAVGYLRSWVAQRLRFLDRYLLPPRVIQTEPTDIVAGWNADIVAESLPAAQSTTASIDASNRVFYSAGLLNSGGLPVDHMVISANENVNYRLCPYDGPNALSLQSPGASGTLVFEAPIATSELFVLGTSGNGNAQVEVVLNYADGTSEQVGGYDIRDWSVREQNLQGDEAVKALGNVRRSDNGYSSDNHYCLFDFSVPVDSERMLESVTFRSTNYAYAAVMALSRIVNEASGIAAQPVMATTKGNRRTYDILGRPLRSAHRGFVIRNGRKYLP